MKFNIDVELEFKINDVDWVVKFVKPDDIEGVGETNYCAYEIYIDRCLRPSQMIMALRHELVHAYRWTYALVSEMELMNIPSTEVEELIANFVEVFGKEIIEVADTMMAAIEKYFLS